MCYYIVISCNLIWYSLIQRRIALYQKIRFDMTLQIYSRFEFELSMSSQLHCCPFYQLRISTKAITRLANRHFNIQNHHKRKIMIVQPIHLLDINAEWHFKAEILYNYADRGKLVHEHFKKEIDRLLALWSAATLQ